MRNPSAMERLGQELQRLHSKAGKPSNREIGVAVGVSHTTVHTTIRGTSLPSWETLRKIVDHLNGDPESVWLLWLAVHERPAPVLRLRTPVDPAQAAYIASLEDTVVAAACVIFGGGQTEQPQDYLTEGVYEQAKRIIETVERLKGAWMPAGPAVQRD